MEHWHTQECGEALEHIPELDSVTESQLLLNTAQWTLVPLIGQKGLHSKSDQFKIYGAAVNKGVLHAP